MGKKNNPHYVSNVEFFQEMVEYLNDRQQKLENGEGEPQVPNSIAEKIMKICRRQSDLPNFRGYPFREDMISDAILNCLTYIHKFDPEKSDNPFAYFTQIAKNAFIRKIKKEKRQTQTKLKYIHSANFDIDSISTTQEQDSEENFSTDIVEQIQEIFSEDDDMMNTFSKNSKKQKASEVSSPLNQLWSGSEGNE